MVEIKSAKICYLLLTSFDGREETKVHFSPRVPKDAPYYFDLGIDITEAETQKLLIEGQEVKVAAKKIDGVVQVWECRYELINLTKLDAEERHRIIRNSLKEKLMPGVGTGSNEMYEEYVIVMIGKVGRDPEKLIDGNEIALAGLLRSANKPLDKSQAETILSSRVKYSQKDMTVVDWEGAIVIADDEDWQSDIDLLVIGNYQLLRYRMLDVELEDKLRAIERLVTAKKPGFLKNQNKMIYDLVKQRLNLILYFSKIEQSLLLIGDWYSAQLYKVVTDEFYIDDWKNTVKSKLDSLGEIQETVAQNLSLSWSRFFDQIQFWGWLVLLIGYFVLYFFDAGWV